MPTSVLIFLIVAGTASAVTLFYGVLLDWSRTQRERLREEHTAAVVEAQRLARADDIRVLGGSGARR